MAPTRATFGCVPLPCQVGVGLIAREGAERHIPRWRLLSRKERTRRPRPTPDAYPNSYWFSRSRLACQSGSTLFSSW